MLMWRASGARRWVSRGMASLIKSDVAFLMNNTHHSQRVDSIVLAKPRKVNIAGVAREVRGEDHIGTVVVLELGGEA